MDYQKTVVLILLGINLVIAVSAFSLIKNYLRAWLLSTLMATLCLSIMAFWWYGSLNHLFFVGSVVVGCLYSLMLSGMIGIPFLIYQRRQRFR